MWLWLCFVGVARVGETSDAVAESPSQAYAHVLLAEYAAAAGDHDTALNELRYALVFDHDNATIRARLRTLDSTHARAAKGGSARGRKATAWLSRHMKKRTLDAPSFEDKTARRVAEFKAR